jgi:hypothetical protein
MSVRRHWLTLVICLVSVGCASTMPDVIGSGRQTEARQLQTRDYYTPDKQFTMRSVLVAMQDLGFTIDNADSTLGIITGTRTYYEDDYELYTMRMTVTVRKEQGNRISVRANARLDDKAVRDPLTYRDFFSALDTAIYANLQQNH